MMLQPHALEETQTQKSLYVSNVPTFVDAEEFEKHFLQLDGCLRCQVKQGRTGKGNFGFVDFASAEAASAAKAIYNGWQGWGNKGLLIQVARNRQQQLQQQQPRVPESSSPQHFPPRGSGVRSASAPVDPRRRPAKAHVAVASPQDRRSRQRQQRNNNHNRNDGGGGAARDPRQRVPPANHQHAHTHLETHLPSPRAQPQQQDLQQVSRIQREYNQQNQQNLATTTTTTTNHHPMLSPPIIPNQQQQQQQQHQVMHAGVNVNHLAAIAPAQGQTLQYIQAASHPGGTNLEILQQNQHQSMPVPVPVSTPQSQPPPLPLMYPHQMHPAPCASASQPAAPAVFVPSPLNVRQNKSNHGSHGTQSGPPCLPPNASKTLFVRHLPSDVEEREAAHIFRPFPGFDSVRIVQKKSARDAHSMAMLCFAEFKTPQDAMACMAKLDGYILDLSDETSPTLKIEFATSLQNGGKSLQQLQQQRHRGSSNQRNKKRQRRS